MFVDDLVEVIRRILVSKVRRGAYNVTPDHAVALKDLAQMVVGISGKDLPVIVAQEGMGLEYSGDNERLRGLLPDFSFTPLETAVRRLYGWYEEHRGLIRRELLLADK